LEKFGRELSSVVVSGKWKIDGSVFVYSWNAAAVNYRWLQRQ